MHPRSPSLQTVLARRNDPRYAPARLAQDYLMKTYGISHFEPETYLPAVRTRKRPYDPDIRVYCDELRKLMQDTARELSVRNIFRSCLCV